MLVKILRNNDVYTVARWLKRSAFASLIVVSPLLDASPWLEAQDPFLRSSAVLLSDAGHISSPIGQYPVRWSLFGDDLTGVSVPESYSVSVAASELQYSLNSAKLNRGNRSAKFVAASDQPVVSGFGQFNRDEWGGYVSYEHLENDFAFRITTGYSKYNEDNDIRWDDSYLSFNAGAWLFSIGNIDKWWGQGWQHNLILGSYAKAAPDINASYINENDWLGVWSLESFIAKPDDAIFDYHSATKLAAKPFKNIAFGATYQAWFDDTSFSEGDEQLALDSRLTLPKIPLGDSNTLYHNLYAEVASTANLSEAGAWLVGWTGSFNVGLHTLRLVFESQQSTEHHSSTQWQSTTGTLNGYPGAYKNASTNTYQIDESYSFALYLQLHNDHNLSFSHQQSEYEQQDRSYTQLNYRLPALAGMVHAGVSYSQVEGETSAKENQTTFWTGYEFRF